ncbi:uncharacterized protein BP5553_00600 [Venustampulla echinocandica]|uniref:BTB domain-containing protein n=1 Tax=Venustampulla echinocandica TaxID=2656787 RepID=A0A370TYN2_9HELO|nr:uncharacterized protein BP5553_00600 [Venustampulla echinocandica]RDL40621.1 hypothetical protein BP5553_00600 [Venustampulla echinocandica]
MEPPMEDTVPLLNTFPYVCCCPRCYAVSTPSTSKCHRDVRKGRHESNVLYLLQSRPTEMITLVIGAKEEKVPCHMALLGFYSEFFDAALYGDFPTPQEIGLPDESLEEVNVFVSWMYTGQIFPGLVCDESLWILGDKLRSQYFANDIMHLLISKYANLPPDSGHYIEAATADMVYSNTTSGSKLRKFVKEVILVEGPLSIDNSGGQKFKEDWKALIARGGDLVTDIALEGSFYNEDFGEGPWYPSNQEKYLEPIQTRSLVEFTQGNSRSAGGGRLKGGRKDERIDVITGGEEEFPIA